MTDEKQLTPSFVDGKPHSINNLPLRFRFLRGYQIILLGDGGTDMKKIAQGCSTAAPPTENRTRNLSFGSPTLRLLCKSVKFLLVP